MSMRSSTGPNLLFILSDQHTQRIAGCYGDSVIRTPALDGLAARGVTFENAYCAAPLCVPSRMALLTGCLPSTQQCWSNSDMLASDRPTLAHGLGAAGYHPVLVGRLHALGPDQLHGYAERAVGDHSTNWIGGTKHDLGVLAKANDPFPESLRQSGRGQSAYEVHDRDVVAEACDYLHEVAASRNRGRVAPFSLTVGFLLPHQPYVAHREDFDSYEGHVGMPELAAPDPASEHPYLSAWRSSTGIREVAPDDALNARTAYYALVTRLDAMIGRLLDTLQASGLSDETLVVYTSDHGDQLGERGLWWKQTFYDESVKVPLILSWPGHLPYGERRTQVINLIDLGPTVLEALGARFLPNADGRSFWRVAQTATAPHVNETFAEYCTDGLESWGTDEPVQQRMLRTERWKLIHYHGYRPQLFDMVRDPRETTDLATDEHYSRVVEALRHRVLSDWDPDAIAATMQRRARDRELLTAWYETVRPPDVYRWELRMEDNWLEPHARAQGTKRR